MRARAGHPVSPVVIEKRPAEVAETFNVLQAVAAEVED